jgi:TonB family protein
MRRIGFFAALLVSLPALAETVEGVITDVATKKPLPNVEVTVGGGRALTDADGRFRISGVPSGPATLSFRGPKGGVFDQAMDVPKDTTVKVTVAFDDSPGESITIKERIGPSKRREPEPVERYDRLTPPYSDELIQSNDWASVWLLLHVNEIGAVTKVDVVKSPPKYKLDELAVKRVKTFRFKPGTNDAGETVPYEVLYKLEYRPYWSLILGGPTDAPCAGTAPMNLDSYMPGYRDCDPPPGYDEPKVKQKTKARAPQPSPGFKR